MHLAVTYGLQSISPIRIGIVDHHHVMIRGLEDLLLMHYLDGHPLELVGQAHQCKEGLQMRRQTQPDIALLDIWLCKGATVENSLNLLTKLKQEQLNIPIIIYTGEVTNKELLKQFYQAGVQGMLFKHDTPEILLEAIYTVFTGGSFFSKQMKYWLQIEDTKLSQYHLESRLPLLSSQERHYLWLTLHHKTRKEIAQIMQVAATTVSEYRKRTFDKLKIIHIQNLDRESTLNLLAQLEPDLKNRFSVLSSL